MNTYRITYTIGASFKEHRKTIEADTVNGFKNTCDSYVFKIGKKVVYVIPKVSVNEEGEQV